MVPSTSRCQLSVDGPQTRAAPSVDGVQPPVSELVHTSYPLVTKPSQTHTMSLARTFRLIREGGVST